MFRDDERAGYVHAGERRDGFLDRPVRGVSPGKRTLTMQLPARTSGIVQRKAATPGSSQATRAGHESRTDWTRVAFRPDVYPAPRSPIQGKGLADEAGDRVTVAPSRGGSKLPDDVQTKMEDAFGADFSAVRIHRGDQAASLGALAYTQGTDIHFDSSHYDPYSQRGQALLGHELTHVVQQTQGRARAPAQAKRVVVNADPSLEREADVMGERAARGERVRDTIGASALSVQRKPATGSLVQLKSINDYADAKNPDHDPGHLTDADIKGTDEYKTLVTRYCHPPWIFTESDAVLACKLAIRSLRQGGTVSIDIQGQDLMHRAHEQAGAAQGAKGLENKLQWVPFHSRQAAADPSLLDSEFAHWMLLANATEPSDTSGKLNCWELVMYGAYKAGVISEGQLKAIYKKAVENVRNGNYVSVGQTFEEATKASSPITFKLGDAKSPKPLAGDIVVFRSAPVHACIATGNVVTNATTGAKEHEVISLWVPNGKKVEKTTIEKLAILTSERPILFWSAKWDGI